MQGAFVVQLRSAGVKPESDMDGWVEEVDTGNQLHFRSESELVAFLRARFAEKCRGGLGTGGKA
jgi:hypothetical protein